MKRFKFLGINVFACRHALAIMPLCTFSVDGLSFEM